MITTCKGLPPGLQQETGTGEIRYGSVSVHCVVLHSAHLPFPSWFIGGCRASKGEALPQPEAHPCWHCLILLSEVYTKTLHMQQPSFQKWGFARAKHQSPWCLFFLWCAPAERICQSKRKNKNMCQNMFEDLPEDMSSPLPGQMAIYTQEHMPEFSPDIRIHDQNVANDMCIYIYTNNYVLCI